MVIISELGDNNRIVKLAGLGEKELTTYLESLIPDYMKHIECLVSNTKYYMASQVCSSGEPLEEKRRLLKGLLQNLKVVGTMEYFYDYSEIFSNVNMEEVEKYGKQLGKANN